MYSKGWVMSDWGDTHVRYSEDIADRLCEEIASGRSVKNICETDDWAPAEKSVYRWLYQYPETFGQKYARAKRAQQDAELEIIAAIADASTPENVQVDRLRIDTRKWSMARLAPQKYGDKIDVTSGGDKITMPTVIALNPVSRDPSND